MNIFIFMVLLCAKHLNWTKYLLHTEYDHEYTIEKLIAGENHSFALFFKVRPTVFTV